MQNRQVYLKCDRNVEVQKPDVFLSDIATLRCSDSALSARLKAMTSVEIRGSECSMTPERRSDAEIGLR